MGQITPVFLVFIPKHRLWVHVRSVSQSMFGVKIRIETFSFLFLLKLFSFYKLVGIKTKVYRHVFVIILIFFLIQLSDPRFFGIKKTRKSTLRGMYTPGW